jgi:GNAT superfamily N-acetyltransferase
MHEIRTSVTENRLSTPDRIRHEDYVTLLEGRGRGWVFETEGTVVAFGVADAETRSIWALFVEPGFEGRGIGRALLEAMTVWLFEQSDGPVWLTTAPATRAESFYRAAGWRETGRINGEVRFELSGAGLSA